MITPDTSHFEKKGHILHSISVKKKKKKHPTKHIYNIIAQFSYTRLQSMWFDSWLTLYSNFFSFSFIEETVPRQIKTFINSPLAYFDGVQKFIVAKTLYLYVLSSTHFKRTQQSV